MHACTLVRMYTCIDDFDYTVDVNLCMQVRKRTDINFIHSSNGLLGYYHVISDTLIIFIKAVF